MKLQGLEHHGGEVLLLQLRRGDVHRRAEVDEASGTPVAELAARCVQHPFARKYTRIMLIAAVIIVLSMNQLEMKVRRIWEGGLV